MLLTAVGLASILGFGKSYFYFLGIVFSCYRCCMCAVRKMRFCNAFSSFDVTLVVSFVKECFRLQIKGKFYINRKLFWSFCVIMMGNIEIRFRADYGPLEGLRGLRIEYSIHLNSVLFHHSLC